MPLLLHGEVTDPDVDLFSREDVFIETKLKPLVARFPALKIVMEHITTQAAVDFIRFFRNFYLASCHFQVYLFLSLSPSSLFLFFSFSCLLQCLNVFFSLPLFLTFNFASMIAPAAQTWRPP